MLGGSTESQRRRKRVSWDPERAASPPPSLQRLHKRARQLSNAAVDAAEWAPSSSSSSSSSGSSSSDDDDDSDNGNTLETEQTDGLDSSDVELDDPDTTTTQSSRGPTVLPELPSVVLAGILARCGLRQAALAACVCRAWNSAFCSPAAWRILDLERPFGSQHNRWVGEDLEQTGESGDVVCNELPSALRSFCSFMLKDGAIRLSQVRSIRARASSHHRWISNPSLCEVPSSVLLHLVSSTKMVEHLRISGTVTSNGMSAQVGSLLRLHDCSIAVGVQDRSWVRVFGGLGGVCELDLRLRFVGHWDDDAAGTSRLTGQLNCMPGVQHLRLSCIDTARLHCLPTVRFRTGPVERVHRIGLGLTGLVLPALRTLKLSASKPGHQICRLGRCSLPALQEAAIEWELTAENVAIMMKQLLNVCLAFEPAQCPSLRQLTIRITVSTPHEQVPSHVRIQLEAIVSTVLMATEASLKAAVACGRRPSQSTQWFEHTSEGLTGSEAVPVPLSSRPDKATAAKEVREVHLKVEDYLTDHARNSSTDLPASMWWCLIFSVKDGSNCG